MDDDTVTEVSDAELMAVVAQAKKEVLEDMGTAVSSRRDVMPLTVKSFAELHDYVDANEYGGFCDPDRPASKWDTDLLNQVQDLVDRWLATGQAYVERIMMPTRVSNENCLEGYRCPHCGHEEEFRVDTVTTVRLIDSGTDDSDSSFEWDDDAMTACERCGHRAANREFLIGYQQLHVKPTMWLTLGELRRRTAHLPDETPLTAWTPDGGGWYNLELDESGIPKSHPPHPDSDDQNSVILGTKDDFDTRQW